MSGSLQQTIAEIDALVERRRTAQARVRLKGALAQHPNDWRLLLQVAWVEYLDRHFDAAMATLRQVLAQAPHSEPARALLFDLQLEQNELVAAEQVVVELLRERPQAAHYYARYAEVMIRAMQLQKARALCQEGLKCHADDPGCLAAASLCDLIERPRGATSHALQQLLVHHPQWLRTLLLVTIALHDRGDYNGASRIAQELVRAQPDNADIVQLAAELKATTHWSLLPLWPLRRWGWGGSIALWLLGIVAVQTLARSNSVAAGILGFCILGYALYSWVWPPILRRWVFRV
jgi:tetratricopeptide (TPR) repeat protein